jgi:hypothetical protein
LRYPFENAFRRLGTVAGSYYFFANHLLTRLIPLPLSKLPSPFSQVHPGFTFWLFVKTTTTSGLYGSLADEECLSLRSVLIIPDIPFTGKKDGERY